MRIYVASIDYRGVTNFYAALTDAALTAQLAEYCRSDWPEDLAQPEDDGEAVSVYFDYRGNGGDEWHDIAEIEVPDPEPADRLTADEAREVCEFLASSGIAAALLALANGDGPIVLDGEGGQ